MAFTYIEHNSGLTKMIERIDEEGNSSWIPIDSSNSDYQRYLRHLAGEDESGTLS